MKNKIIKNSLSKIIFLLALLVILNCFMAFKANAGTLIVQRNQPTFVTYECELDYQKHSDYFGNVYNLSCNEQPQIIVQQSIFDKSQFFINGIMTFSCPVYTSEISPDDFYIVLDCRDNPRTLFSNGFD